MGMKRRWLFVSMLAALILISAGWWLVNREQARGDAAKHPLGLFTSLPILWSEQADLRDVLAEPREPHWAKAALAKHGQVGALNTLLDLSAHDRLIMAQPRPLSPDENVALDRWVRAGGTLLMFADPMLTEESAFALGDRRRPQDVVLISPILARWGLELRFDDAQQGGLRENAGEAIQVNLPGQIAAKAGGFESHCNIGPEGLIARCRVGKGRAVIVADAALLEMSRSGDVQADRLEMLMDKTFRDGAM